MGASWAECLAGLRDPIHKGGQIERRRKAVSTREVGRPRIAAENVLDTLLLREVTLPVPEVATPCTLTLCSQELSLSFKQERPQMTSRELRVPGSRDRVSETCYNNFLLDSAFILYGVLVDIVRDPTARL